LELLTKAVLSDIQCYARLANENEEEFVRQLNLMSAKDQKTEIDRYKKRIADIKSKLTKIEGLVRKAFEKLASGTVSDAIYKSLEQGYQRDISALESELPILITALETAESQKADMSEEIKKLKCYAGVKELTREVVTNLIQTIYISEPTGKGKKKAYNLEIQYRFNNPRSITHELFLGIGNWEEVKAG
jgi:predicted  nucleic acid-binding Zn-ribbon protein